MLRQWIAPALVLLTVPGMISTQDDSASKGATPKKDGLKKAVAFAFEMPKFPRYDPASKRKMAKKESFRSGIAGVVLGAFALGVPFVLDLASISIWAQLAPIVVGALFILGGVRMLVSGGTTYDKALVPESTPEFLKVTTTPPAPRAKAARNSLIAALLCFVFLWLIGTVDPNPEYSVLPWASGLAVVVGAVTYLLLNQGLSPREDAAMQQRENRLRKNLLSDHSEEPVEPNTDRAGGSMLLLAVLVMCTLTVYILFF